VARTHAPFTVAGTHAVTAPAHALRLYADNCSPAPPLVVMRNDEKPLSGAQLKSLDVAAAGRVLAVCVVEEVDDYGEEGARRARRGERRIFGVGWGGVGVLDRVVLWCGLLE
jgi:hypothetical protein